VIVRTKSSFQFPFQKSALRQSVSLLGKRDRSRVFAIVLIQIFSNLLDLLGVALIGVLGALAVNGVQSKPPGNRVGSILRFLGIENFTFQQQVVVIGVSATLVLIGRTIVSVTFTRRTLFFLSRIGADISSELFKKFVSQRLVQIQAISMQEALYIVTVGVSSITVGLIGSLVGLATDLSLLFIMGAGLFVVDPSIAISTVATFGLISGLIYRYLHARARKLGNESALFSVHCNEKIIEVLSSYRELVVRDRRNFYVDEISDFRKKLAANQAESAFMPNISKYIIETVVVLGMLLISASQFLLQDASHAVATLSVFMAAGTRIAPAILRIQQSAIVIKSSLGSAEPTLNLIHRLRDVSVITPNEKNCDFIHKGFQGKITLQDVSVKYPLGSENALDGVNFEISEGSSVAIVGESGAGKTTLADVLLGIVGTVSGRVEISGQIPETAIRSWPGAIGYVPQDVVLTKGTIRQNIGLGFPSEMLTDDRLETPLRLSQLEDFIRELPDGIDTEVGERGTRLSGGQRQRIGIARALFTNPKLLVFDEATSALDGKTEFELTEAISALKGKLTLVTIAHRLSTIRNSDVVLYLDKGKLVAQGTIDQVRAKVPNFDKLAAEMGL